MTQSISKIESSFGLQEKLCHYYDTINGKDFVMQYWELKNPVNLLKI